MRCAWIAMLAVAGWCLAQEPTPSPAPSASPSAPPKDLPTQPTMPGSPKREGELPPPNAGKDEDRDLHIVKGKASLKGDMLLATDGVQLLYRGYQIFADEVRGDKKTQIFTATGNVRLYGQDASIVGQRVTIDFDKKTFEAIDADSVLRPGIVGYGVRGDLFVSGGRTYGSKKQVFGEGTAFTSCNLEHPHFEIFAERTDIRPDKRVVLHGVRVKLFGRTMLRVPYLSFPINQPTYKYLPEFGRTSDLGYYLKTRWGLNSSPTTALDGRVEYYQKLGGALGLDYQYGDQSKDGFLNLYGISGPRPLTDINQSHRQRFAWGNITIQNSYQKTNFFNAPQNATLANRAAVAFVGKGRATTFTYFRNNNETQTYRTLNQTVSLNDFRQWSARLRTNLDLNLSTLNSRFSLGNPVRREQFDVRFRGEQDLVRANLLFQYSRSIPIGENQNFFSSTDVTPLVTLQSDAKRLLGERWEQRLPFRLEVSSGEFRDPVGRGRIVRHNLDFSFFKNSPSERRLRFDLSGRFNQGVYSNGTAQYVLNVNPTLSYRFGRDSAFTLRYNYLRPYGFSPLQIDRSGNINLLTADASFRPLRSVLLGAQTGYDFRLIDLNQKTGYQPVGIRAEWHPRPWFMLRGLSTYEPSLNAWSNLRFDMAWKAGDTFVSAGARFDGVRKKWAALNLFVDSLKIGRLRVSTILNYNGYLQRFEARHFQFTYDLHCAEAVLTLLDNPVGFRSGRTITFYVRLKAFPFESPFGIGQRGQGIGTGTGRG